MTVDNMLIRDVTYRDITVRDNFKPTNCMSSSGVNPDVNPKSNLAQCYRSCRTVA